MPSLDDLAAVLRSKNASPFYTTIDVFFDDPAVFRGVVDSGVITPERVAELYGLERREVYGVYFVESALGIKVTINKRVNTGDPACVDVMGAHQHLPMAALEIPL
jgi:hypothetical protein